MHKKNLYVTCGQAQADLGLRCPLTESVDIVVYVNKQKLPRLDCTDAHTDLDPFRVLCIK